MAGKVTSLEGMIPEPKLREVISYELSPLFNKFGAERYSPDELVATRGIAIYRQMMSDEQVKAVMVFKRDAITSRGWTFAFDKHATLSEDEKQTRIRVMDGAVEKMRGSFEDALNAVAKGRQYGFSMTEIVHDVVTIGDKAYVGLHSLLARDASTFKFYTDPYGNLLKVVQRVDGSEIEVDAGKFVHYVHCPEEDPYYGMSDLRQAYRSWYVKDAVIKLYATFLERFAGGFTALELQEGHNIVPGSKQHDALQDVLRNIRNLSGMILPPFVKLNVVTPSTTGEYREALTYFDLAIAKALLVPNLLGLSHAGQTGSFSQSQTQLEAFFWTLNADTRRLEACLNEQLFKPLAAMNWGDSEYPAFRFKPASQEHVRWLVTTWKELVGAKAVETTAEDEAYLRKLLDMPAREIKLEDEGDDALASDPTSAFTGVQITAMLDVLAKVADGSLPPETAIQVLIQSFPISEEEAHKLVDPIEVKEPEPVPPPPGVPVPGGEVVPPSPDSQEEVAPSPDDAVPGKPSGEVPPRSQPPVVAHTRDGKPRLVSMEAFQSAALRVEFAVIERRSTVASDDAVQQLARLVVKATKRVLGDAQRMAELLDDDMSDIENMKFDGGDVGKIKSTAKDALAKGWSIGIESARRELGKAGKASVTSFADLRDKAAQYFEANGFRMAANISDGARALIQQQLIQAVKAGSRAEEVIVEIFRLLIEKGFTTIDAMEREVVAQDVIDSVASVLQLPETANVPAYLNTLVRTNTFEALNEARYAEFTDPALDGFVEALEYSAILDDRTTEICQELDGKVFAADSPEWETYRPPNHYNCRSVLIPVTVVDNWNGDESSKPTVQPASGFGPGGGE